MTTNVSKLSCTYDDCTIPLYAYKINATTGETVITAFVLDDLRACYVYKFFLDQIGLNQKSQFSLVRAPFFQADYVERWSAVHTEEPIRAALRVLCVYNTPRRDPLTLEQLMQRVRTSDLYKTTYSLDSRNSETQDVLIKTGSRDRLSYQQAEAKLDDEILSQTIGLPQTNGTQRSGLRYDRIVSRQTIVPQNEGYSSLNDRRGLTILNGMSDQRMEELKRETL